MKKLLNCVVVLMLASFALPLSAQEQGEDIEAMWSEYDALTAEYEAVMAEVDATSPGTSTGDRYRREAIELSSELLQLMEYLVVNDRTLVSDDLAAAWDWLLTTKQVLGSLYVETRQCEAAVVTLQAVLDHPETTSRPLLQEAAQTRFAEAEQCVQEQQAQAQAQADAQAANTEQGGMGEEPEPAARGFRPAHGVLIGGGALLLGYGLVEVLSMGDVNEYRDLGDLCEVGCSSADAATYTQLGEDLKPRKTIAIGLLAASAAALGVGTVLLVTDRPDDRPATTLEMTPWADRRSAGLLLTLRR
jgi:hypothetical protein